MPGKFGGSEREREREMGYHVVVFGFFTGLLDKTTWPFTVSPNQFFFFQAHSDCIQIDFSESGKQKVQVNASVGWLVMFGCANRSNSDRLQS